MHQSNKNPARLYRAKRAKVQLVLGRDATRISKREIYTNIH